MAVRYKPEVHDFIRTHLDQFTIQEMAEEVNWRFGTDFNYGKMKAYYNNHKLKAGKRQIIRSKLWPEDVVEVLLANYKGRTYAEMLEILWEETGREYTQAQLKCYYHNHKLNSGRTGRFEKGHEPGNKGKKLEEYVGEERAAEIKKQISATQFKKGDRPVNEMPVGSIVVNSDGYKLRKKQMTGSLWERWEFLHRAVWVEHHGEIPDGMMVSFRDSDPLNCDIDNLMLISKSENARLNRRGLRFEDPDLTDAAVSMVRLEGAIRDRRKKKK